MLMNEKYFNFNICHFIDNDNIVFNIKAQKYFWQLTIDQSSLS